MSKRKWQRVLDKHDLKQYWELKYEETGDDGHMTMRPLRTFQKINELGMVVTGNDTTWGWSNGGVRTWYQRPPKPKGEEAKDSRAELRKDLGVFGTHIPNHLLDELIKRGWRKEKA